MKRISWIESFKYVWEGLFFSIKTCLRNPLFLLVSSLITVVLGAVISSLAVFFLIPAFDFIEQLRGMLVKKLIMPGSGISIQAFMNPKSLMQPATLFKIEGVIRSIIAEMYDKIILFVAGLLLLAVVVKLLTDALRLGWMKIALQFVDTSRASLGSLFCGWRYIIRYFFGMVLYYSALVCVLLFFMVPVFVINAYAVAVPQIIVGLFLLLSLLFVGYLGAALWYYPYLIIDKGLGCIGSLRASYNLSGGIKSLFLLSCAYALVIGIFNTFVNLLPETVGIIIGSIAFVCGLLVYCVHSAYVYRRLS